MRKIYTALSQIIVACLLLTACSQDKASPPESTVEVQERSEIPQEKETDITTIPVDETPEPAAEPVTLNEETTVPDQVPPSPEVNWTTEPAQASAARLEVSEFETLTTAPVLPVRNMIQDLAVADEVNLSPDQAELLRFRVTELQQTYEQMEGATPDQQDWIKDAVESIMYTIDAATRTDSPEALKLKLEEAERSLDSIEQFTQVDSRDRPRPDTP